MRRSALRGADSWPGCGAEREQRRAHQSGFIHTGIARASGDVKVCAVTGHGTIVTPFVTNCCAGG